MLTLYYMPGSCSLASHIVLEELDEPFTAQKVDLSRGEHLQPGYLAVNPQGRVPALATEKGVITESPAILQYLGSLKPELYLLPDDSFARAQLLGFLCWLSAHVHVSISHVSRPERYTNDLCAREAMRAKTLEVVPSAFDRIEEMLSGGYWLFGHYSVADPYLLVWRRAGSSLGLDMERWPRLVEHGGKVMARPAALRAFAKEGLAE